MDWKLSRKMKKRIKERLSGFHQVVFINFFSSYKRSSMQNRKIKTKIFYPYFQCLYIICNVNALIMQNHGNIIKRIARIKFSKVTRFINKNA